MLALDSNTISYFFRGDMHVVERLRLLAPEDLCVPAVVAYELRCGLLRLPGDLVPPRLQALDAFLMPLRVLPFDALAAQHAAAIRAALEASGTPIGPHDLLIAATVRAVGVALITRNVRQFGRVPGLDVVNWHPD